MMSELDLALNCHWWDVDSEIRQPGQRLGLYHGGATQGRSVRVIIQKESHLLFISHYSFRSSFLDFIYYSTGAVTVLNPLQIYSLCTSGQV